MKLFRLAVVCILALSFNLAPIAAQAAGLIPCGGPGEESCQACHVTKLIDNVVVWLIAVLSIVCSILILIAGFNLMTSAGNAAAKKAAKDTFVNIFIGFLLILGGWLLVDTLMKALLTNQAYGVWNQIQCVYQPGVRAGETASTTLVGPNSSLALGNGDCTASSIQSAAATGGYTLSEAQSRTLSCITNNESRCSLGARNGQSTATGVLQVVMGYNDPCHNLNVPNCTQAARTAGYTVSDNLNCSTAHTGGAVRSGMEYLAAACRAASSNFNCNVSASACLVQVNRGFSAWSSSQANRNCIAQYNQ